MLIESMRDIGYSLDTALADIIDNSITAQATDIELLADTTSDAPKLAILDNGKGMSEASLLAAMHPGSTSPLDDRPANDLGRFGLGLKTASFSQCRKLTIVTRQGSKTSVAVWDLDYVAKMEDWLVQLPESPEGVPWAERLTADGTLIVWEQLDRLAPPGGVGEGAEFVRRLNVAREHLELVFHRYLAGERGTPKLKIKLNGRALKPFDPFDPGNPATIVGPAEQIGIRDYILTVQAFTLPHHKKLTSADWERNAGRAGYVKNQGFYVYRAKRLIIHGTWFGLARQTELTKLARVRIDMPNGLDADWKIDVKKASAQPPYVVRERLRRIIETIGATSKRVYTARGQRLISDSRLPVWNRYQDKNEISYRINLEHPTLAAFSGGLSPEQQTHFDHVLALVGATIPTESLFVDFGAEPEKVTIGTLPDDSLREVTASTVRALRTTGVSDEDIRLMLQVTEPFRSNWPATSLMLDEAAMWNDTDD